MTDVHTLLGWIAIGLNAGAAALGGVAWLLRANPKPFWWLLRAGGEGILLLPGEAVHLRDILGRRAHRRRPASARGSPCTRAAGTEVRGGPSARGSVR